MHSRPQPLAGKYAIFNNWMSLNSLPIGIFDSGVGGLTVYRALHDRLPNERFIYLGDTARVPYGTKSLATVERYAIENSLFLASRGIKMLVVACNTASALALPAIRKAVGLDVVGVIGPGGRKAVEITKEKENAKIAVINWYTVGLYPMGENPAAITVTAALKAPTGWNTAARSTSHPSMATRRDTRRRRSRC